jgi:flagellar hook-associated protein 2
MEFSGLPIIARRGACVNIPRRPSPVSASSPTNFRTILDRALKIAAVPSASLQNGQADLLSKKKPPSDFQSTTADLAAAVKTPGGLGESKALQASVSNANRVSVNGSVGAGFHTISDIISVAQATLAITLSGYATSNAIAVSADAILELVAGGRTYTLNLTARRKSNLEGPRDAINALNAGVWATVLNTGAGNTPHYLSLAAEATGVNTVELRETVGDPNFNLFTTTNTGANAVFKLDGLNVVKTDNVVGDIVPGGSPSRFFPPPLPAKNSGRRLRCSG